MMAVFWKKTAQIAMAIYWIIAAFFALLELSSKMAHAPKAVAITKSTSIFRVIVSPDSCELEAIALTFLTKFVGLTKITAPLSKSAYAQRAASTRTGNSTVLSAQVEQFPVRMEGPAPAVTAASFGTITHTSARAGAQQTSNGLATNAIALPRVPGSIKCAGSVRLTQFPRLIVARAPATTPGHTICHPTTPACCAALRTKKFSTTIKAVAHANLDTFAMQPTANASKMPHSATTTSISMKPPTPATAWKGSSGIKKEPVDSPVAITKSGMGSSACASWAVQGMECAGSAQMGPSLMGIVLRVCAQPAVKYFRWWPSVA
jgi:hypothetical protein